MATQNSLYTAMYKVLGANAVVSTNRSIASSQRLLFAASRQSRLGMLGVGSALANSMAIFAAAGLAIRRVIRDYERYTVSVSQVRTVLAAQLRNQAAVTNITTAYSEAVGRDLGYSLVESNEALNTLLQTGLGVHRSMRVYSTSMQLARVADMDTARATQFLTDTMNMFRVEQAETGETTRHFARRMATQLSVSANMASTNIEQLQQAFRYAGGEMSAMGYNSRETIAALAGLSSMGLRGTTAGTRLRQAIAKLINPTQQTISEFRELGVSEETVRGIMTDTDGNLRDLGSSMSRLSAIMRGLPTQEAKLRMLFQMFGLRGVSAGTALAGMTEAGERTLSIMDRLGEQDVVSGSILDDQSRERMMSFGMQMQQLREGVTDLSIAFGEVLFGAMSTSERGFGTNVRRMAAAIRLSGHLTDMTSDQRREWNALSSEERVQGANLRELFESISNIIKVLGTLAKGVLWCLTNFPKLTIATLFLVSAMGGWLNTITAIVRIGPLLLSNFRTIGYGLSYVSTGMRAVTIATWAAAAAIVALSGPAIRSARRLSESYLQVSNSQREMRETGAGDVATWLREQIPIVGELAAAFVDLGNAGAQAYAWYQRLRSIRENRQAETERSAAVSLQARYEQMRGQARYAGMDRSEVYQAAATREREEMVNRLAILTRGRVDTAEVASQLQAAGMSSLEAAQTAYDVIRRSAAFTGVGTEELGYASNDAEGIHRAQQQTITNLTNLARVVDQVAGQIGSADMSVTESPVGWEIPNVQDAYINRGGLVNASSGDLLVSRNHLANVISGRRGDMAGPAAAAVSGGGPSEIVVTVPVVIDGREIARAVGRQHITHLERSGARFEPQQRRTMSESGFMERLG